MEILTIWNLLVLAAALIALVCLILLIMVLLKLNRNKNNQLLEQLNQNLRTDADSLRKEMVESAYSSRTEIIKLNELKFNTVQESITQNLERLFKSMGEMQALAANVGDLKRLLTNVKTRGTWGEIRLDNILEQILTPDQYQKSVCIKSNTQERVDFAVCLPGQGNGDVPAYLPIDSKFPQEAYLALQDAQHNNDTAVQIAALKTLRIAITGFTKDISDKYIDPPNTTDFAIMFLPTESLYVEVLGITGLVEELQVKHRVVVAGPTTMAALLNSLQIGFRTLVIQKRSSEVWQILGTVKTEFIKFSDIIARAEKQLATVGKTLEDARKKTSTITSKLRKVETVDEFAGLAEPLAEGGLEDDFHIDESDM